MQQVRQAFNPVFGMFVYDDTKRLHWFRASGLDMEMEFELIGILIGEFPCRYLVSHFNVLDM